MQVLIPMAGMGKRFKAAGYKKPKPLIDVHGRPMIDRVLENLRTENVQTFGCAMLQDIFNQEMAQIMRRYAVNMVLLDEPTIGAVFTVQTLLEALDVQEDFVIAACDQIVNIDFQHFYNYCTQTKYDGVIMTFPSRAPMCSYTQVDNQQRVLRVAEKECISPYANVGIFYFRSRDAWQHSMDQLLKDNVNYHGEYYIAPMYNYVNATIYHVPASCVHLLGTPQELESYLQGVKA